MWKLVVIALGLSCWSAAAAGQPWSAAELADKAKIAGIDDQLVVDPVRRVELVEALRERIELGYKQEKAFKMAGRRVGRPGELSPEEWRAYRVEYLAYDAVGFREALNLASNFACVELFPMLVERSDMTVDWGDDVAPRCVVSAIVGMGRPALAPVLGLIEGDPDERERLFAIEVLKGAGEPWRKMMGGESIAVFVARSCDVEDQNVLRALDSLKGEMGWEELFEAAGKPVLGKAPPPARPEAGGEIEARDEPATGPTVPMQWVIGVVLFSLVAAGLGIGVSLWCGRGRKTSG